MNISKSDVNAGVEKTERWVDETANAVVRGTAATAAEAKKTIRTTGEKVDRAIDENSNAVTYATDALQRPADAIREIFDKSSREIVETFQQRRAQVKQLSDESMKKTTDYVQERPLQAMLIAAAIGAAAVLLFSRGPRR